jgi:hypothetical protein
MPSSYVIYFVLGMLMTVAGAALFVQRQLPANAELLRMLRRDNAAQGPVILLVGGLSMVCWSLWHSFH